MTPLILDLLSIIIAGFLLSLMDSCQPPFTKMFDVCLFWNTSVKVSWCQSQAYCGQFNGELVTGQNAMKLNYQYLGIPLYFIGLTDLLHERRNNRSGWMWTNGSLEPDSDLLNWVIGEPGSNTQGDDYVSQYIGSGVFGDNVKYSLNPNSRSIPMCQARQGLSPTWKTKRSSLFRRVPVPVFSDPYNYAGDGGCTQNITGVETINSCAVECLGEELDWCVAFYYHAGEQLCRLVLYTDQAIDVGNGAGWEKRVRQV